MNVFIKKCRKSLTVLKKIGTMCIILIKRDNYMASYKATIVFVQLWSNHPELSRKEIEYSVYGSTENEVDDKVNEMINTHSTVSVENGKVLYQCYSKSVTRTKINIAPTIVYRDTDTFLNDEEMFMFIKYAPKLVIVPEKLEWHNKNGEILKIEHNVSIDGVNYQGYTLEEAIHLHINKNEVA